MAEQKGMIPSCWGSAMWHVIHSIAYVYNPRVDKQRYFDFFSGLGSILPCEDCKIHYYQNLNKEELINALQTNEDLFRWTYDLHNKVNIQTKVPQSNWPSYESVKKKYGSFEATCSEIPGVCGSSSPVKRKIKMIEQFGHINEEQLPFLVTTVILAVLLLICIIYIGVKEKK